jgi:hypothetical protein
MAIGNPVSLTGNIASKSISVTATAGQTVFTVTMFQQSNVRDGKQ